MKLNSLIIAFITLSYCFILSCKKDNNRISSATYQLDSIRINITDSNLTSPVINSYLIINDNMPFTWYPVQLINDTSFYNAKMINTDCETDSLHFSAVIYSDKFYRLYAHSTLFCDGFANVEYQRNYSYNNNYLNSIKYINNGLYYSTLNYTNAELLFNYNNNKLSNINFKEQKSFGTDTTEVNYLHTLLYLHNFANQNDMIGIDVNDFIMDAYLYELDRFPYFPTTNVITPVISKVYDFNNSYNIHADYLIEELNFQYRNASTVTSKCTSSYLFDSTKDNRIKMMNIDFANTSSAGNSKRNYTLYFYYKN